METVRCVISPDVKLLQFTFGSGTAAKQLLLRTEHEMLQRGGRSFGSLDVYHLPTPGMDPENGQLTDYFALYELLTDPVVPVAQRRTLSNREPECGKYDLDKFKFTPRSGGCGAVRMAE
jgi:hypothetical protein